MNYTNQSLLARTSILSAALGILFFSSTAFGLGYRTSNNSAEANAQADAFTAQADDASAIYYNPAGLTQVKGTEILLGSMFWFPDYRLQSNSGKETMHTFSVLPHGFITTDFGLSDWSFGFGVHNGYGTSQDWGDTGPLRFIATKAQMRVIDFAPTAAYKITESVSIGASLNIYYGTLDWERKAFLAPFLPEGDVTLKGDGEGIGGTVGLLWKIDAKNALGAVYRSPFSIKFDGHTELDSSFYNPGRSPSDVKLDFPQMVTVGYAYRPIDALKLEFDLEWVNWSSLNEPVLYSSNRAYDKTVVAFNWDDSIAVKIGAEYRLDEHWALRAGYAWFSNSVPTSTFSPLEPDSTLNTFTAGFGYSTPRWGIDLCYQLDLWQNRVVQDSGNSPAVDGTWHNKGNAILLSTRFKF